MTELLTKEIKNSLDNYERLLGFRSKLFSLVIANKDDEAEIGRLTKQLCLEQAELENNVRT